jgi:hypothetical protein
LCAEDEEGVEKEGDKVGPVKLKLGGVAGGDISSGPQISMSDEGPTQFDRAFLQGMDVTVLCIRMVE